MTREEFIEKICELKAYNGNELTDKNITREAAETIADCVSTNATFLVERDYDSFYEFLLKSRR